MGLGLRMAAVIAPLALLAEIAVEECEAEIEDINDEIAIMIETRKGVVKDLAGLRKQEHREERKKLEEEKADIIQCIINLKVEKRKLEGTLKKRKAAVDSSRKVEAKIRA